MTAGDIALLALLIGVPLLAAVAGTLVAARFRQRRALSLAGFGLAALGLADLVGLYVWYDEYCWETWQPCSPAAGMAVWLVWVGLGVVLLVGSLVLLYARYSRHRDAETRN